jgi:hypothetical protein
MMAPNFSGVMTALISFGVIITLAVGGFVWGIFYLLDDNEYKTNEKLEPVRIELEIKNKTEVDTVYIYHIK